MSAEGRSSVKKDPMAEDSNPNAQTQPIDGFISRLRLRLLYRVRVKGSDQLPRVHGALLVSNRVSVVDPVLIRRAVKKTLGKAALARLEFLNCSGIVGDELDRALTKARQQIEEGQLVCLFAEGTIERGGRLLRFTTTLERIIGGLKLPIIPVTVDRPWGSIARREEGAVRWKWPRRFPYNVTVCFGAPLPSSSSAFRVRRMVQEIQARLFERRKKRGETLTAKFIRTARRFPFRQAIDDHTGRRLNFLKALAGALTLRKALEKHLDDGPYIGVLLPPSGGGALVNVALSLLGKVPVNLNYTISKEAFEHCLEKAQIKTIITSKLFLRKLEMDARDEFFYVEDLRKEVGALSKLRGFLAASLLPASLIRKFYSASEDPSAPACVLFSSGSTGDPKGVILSHYNVLSNIQAVSQVFHLEGDDRVVGVLPFFHAFGFTITLWFPLVVGQGALFSPDPRDGKAVAELVRDRGGTLLVGPPTFFQMWMRHCKEEDFKTLRYALTGAEKLKPALARSFREKYGMPLLEGYGATEVAPVVSINTFDVREGDEVEIGHKEGSLGHPLPGVAVKVIDLETDEELDAGAEGMLCVKGPNVMVGYLDDPDRTADVLQDGWYITGDLGKIDEDGFLEITDRLSRFSKIGGEMVPHVGIESELQDVSPDVRFGVTSVPDDIKGERIVVVHTPLEDGSTPADLCSALREKGIPNLWIPKPSNFIEVDEIPVLATGKTDLRALKDIANRGG